MLHETKLSLKGGRRSEGTPASSAVDAWVRTEAPAFTLHHGRIKTSSPGVERLQEGRNRVTEEENDTTTDVVNDENRTFPRKAAINTITSNILDKLHSSCY